MNGDVVVELDQVSRVHGTGAAAVQALSGVSVQVRAGELEAVMGPSGSGKSTLLNLAGALDAPTRGRVMIEGRDTATLSPDQLAALRRRRIGFVFQDLNLIPRSRRPRTWRCPWSWTATARAGPGRAPWPRWR